VGWHRERLLLLIAGVEAAALLAGLIVFLLMRR
jgi:hypothetical protein